MRPDKDHPGSRVLSISIHASREGCDPFWNCGVPVFDNFNPRIPRGMRRRNRNCDIGISFISIHASREGCDNSRCNEYPCIPYFNPRIPRGMRQAHQSFLDTLNRFQSTHPARDATCLCRPSSISHSDFNPRIPRGMRLADEIAKVIRSTFQSTHPARDAT